MSYYISHGEREDRRKVFTIIKEQDILFYSDLLDTLLEHSDGELFEYAAKEPLLYSAYLESRYCKKYDETTGTLL